MISARTNAELSAAKAHGTKLGMSARSKSDVRRIAASGAKANKTAALERIDAVRWAIESAPAGDASLRAASDLHNARGIASLGGGRWHAPSLLKAARKLGLR